VPPPAAHRVVSPRAALHHGLLALAFLAAAAHAEPLAPAAKALVDEARAAMRNDPERSRALAEQALAELARRPDVDLQVQAHWVLCDYQAERDRNAAQKHLAAARVLLPRASQPQLAAQLLGCEGDLSELAGDSTRAMALYEESVAAAQAAHDDEVLANALFQRGYLRGVRGDLATGLSDLRRAIDIYERAHLPQQASNTLNAVATLYDRMGDHVQARRYFEETLKVQRGAGLLREQAVTYHNLGRALENLGDWPGARASFESVLALSKQIAYPRAEAYALRGLASVDNAEGHGEAALRLLDRASELLAKAPDERLRAQVALQRGIAWRLVHRPAQSLAELNEALKVFDAAESKAEAAITHGELAATHAALGDYKSAYEQGALFKDASDRLLKRQIDERFATLKVEFDTAVTDRENQALKREKIATERALAQEQRASALRAVALVLAALLVAILAVLMLRHRRTSRQMRGLAMTDELTRLSNRRHLMAQLQDMVAAGRSGAVLIADLDLFKAINDRHGHLVGDEILRAVAATLGEAVPPHAQLGRLGGEEFIVLLPHTGLDEALEIAERARRAVAALDASRWLPDRGVTISIGVTVCLAKDTLSATLRRADEALYDAKAGGRNCVRANAPGVPGGRRETAAPAAASPSGLHFIAPDTVQ
jgi:diguanylate cyclase (GGDEF)-like protein